MNRIIKIILIDILKSKIVLAYTFILAILSWSSFALEDNSAKGILTILNVILFTVPLVSILFATIYLYNSSEFIELLLSQPIKRRKIWISLFLGLSISMILAFFVGAGIPLLINSPDSIGIIMLINGCLITVIFTALAFLSSILTRDKAKGIGIAIMTWLFFALLLWKATSKTEYLKLHFLLKFIIVSGVFCIVLIEPSVLIHGKKLISTY